MKEKIVFRNVYSGTTFTVIGDEAAERMDKLGSWERDTYENFRARTDPPPWGRGLAA